MATMTIAVIISEYTAISDSELMPNALNVPMLRFTF